MSDIYNKIEFNMYHSAEDMFRDHFLKHLRNGNIQKAYENGQGKVAITFKMTLEQSGNETIIQVDTSFVKSKITDRSSHKVDPDQPGLFEPARMSQDGGTHKLPCRNCGGAVHVENHRKCPFCQMEHPLGIKFETHPATAGDEPADAAGEHLNTEGESNG